MAKVEFLANEDGVTLVVDSKPIKKIYAEDLYCALFDHEIEFQKNNLTPVKSREMLIDGLKSAIDDFIPNWEKTRDKNW